ncbi:MAG TPA: MarR family transcriptional regulator [Acidimicrobiia bacterium]|nr:MarR family transcriptional regulator [Acidimicrobiia bacterium]
MQLFDDERISEYGRLVEAQRHLHRVFDRSLRARVGISSTWYEALLRLGRAPGRRLSTSDLGDALLLSSGGATRLVDRLAAKGLVERLPDPSDRRISWVHLTSDGLRILADATRVHLNDLEEHFVSRLDSAERETLTDLLRRLRSGSVPD